MLLAWGDSDKLFPIEHAQRLADDFPDAELEVICGASTYVMRDRPGERASIITSFVAATER